MGCVRCCGCRLWVLVVLASGCGCVASLGTESAHTNIRVTSRDEGLPDLRIEFTHSNPGTHHYYFDPPESGPEGPQVLWIVLRYPSLRDLADEHLDLRRSVATVPCGASRSSRRSVDRETRQETIPPNKPGTVQAAIRQPRPLADQTPTNCPESTLLRPDRESHRMQARLALIQRTLRESRIGH